MSVNTSYWLEPLWKTFYTVAYIYPDSPTIEYREYTINLYLTMAQLIPCDDLRGVYCKFLNQNPITDAASNRENLLQWVNSLEAAIAYKLSIRPNSLINRISELDRNNPEKGVRRSNIPKSIPAPYRKPGVVSYGIRRTSRRQPQPEPEPELVQVEESVPDNRLQVSRQTRGYRNVVSYGMRKTTKTSSSRSYCNARVNREK